MESIDFYLAGLSVVLALFLILVNIMAYRKSRVRIFAFLMVVFAAILFDGIMTLLAGFSVLVLPISTTALLLISNILVLVLFYYGVVRGS